MPDCPNRTDLIPPHGGYRKLKTYRLGNLIYDATTAFCTRWVSRKDRTFDQMVQAARSGVANIIEGSEASVTSKKTELKLTNVAKASQEELLADYQSFLRQCGLPEWSADSLDAQTVRRARPETLDQLRAVMASIVAIRTAERTHNTRVPQAGGGSDLSDLSDFSDGVRSCAAVRSAPSNEILLEVACNTMITMIRQETYLLARQITRLAADFEREGGFTERLYRVRSKARKSKPE